jgi:glycerol-3-phosphate dehydrogenase (NAD(P)+)
MQARIIGLGNFGTAIGKLLTSNGHKVLGWEYNEAVVEEINREQTNSQYLPGIELSSNLSATHDPQEVFYTCPVVFIALPSAKRDFI